MTLRSLVLFLASSSALTFGCSSTTGGGFFTDGGLGDARTDTKPGIGIGGDGGKVDGGVKTDSGLVKDSGGVVTDTGMTCETCQSTYCSSEISACSSDTKCVDTVNCINACSASDSMCPQNCVDSYASSTFPAFYNCIYDNCLDACSE
jgi:hypothetical protein